MCRCTLQMDAAKSWFAGLMAKEVPFSERVAVCACTAAPRSVKTRRGSARPCPPCLRAALLRTPTAARENATAQATKQAQQEATGWWEGLKQEIKEGKFNTYARVGGYVCMRARHPPRSDLRSKHERVCGASSVINFVLIIFLSWTFFITIFPCSTLSLLLGVVVGFIELPFCCWCIPQCNQVCVGGH